jgi:hypothetical protein
MKGNKGEWSELYTFFKLLAEGKLFSADEDLEKTNSFVELLSVYRKDGGKNLNFKIKSNSKVNIVDADSGNTLLTFPQSEAGIIADSLGKEIKSKTGVSQELIDSIQQLFITQVADKSLGKGDINIHIYDPIHGINSVQEFSIKSFLGSKPTLFNANKTTNIIFKITSKNNEPISDEELITINSINSRHKYIDRIKKIYELGYHIIFDSYESDIFKLNLQIIDSDLPEIIAHIVKDKYIHRIVRINDIIEKLRKDNPMKYDLSQGHKFYEYRIVNFLVEAAMGMTSKTVWSGKYDVVGGIIIIKPNADMLCYHLIDFNKFKKYLKNSSRLDNPSGSKMGYGAVYKSNNESFIKLNFQIKA